MTHIRSLCRLLTLTHPRPLRTAAAALFAATVAVANAQAVPDMSPIIAPKSPAKPTGSPVHAYDIPLLADGTSFNQPTNQWSYYFEIRPGVTLVDGAYVDLNYTCSSTLVANQGSITIMLNDRPVESRLLPTPNSRTGSWRLKLPLGLFKRDFNELKLVTRQRTADGECRDLDNMANWIRFTEGCKLHLVRTDPPVFPLYAYPFPYLDPLSSSPVASTWSISSSSSKADLAHALRLASDWGKAEPVRGLGIHLTTAHPSRGQRVDISGEGGEGSEGTVRAIPGSGSGNSRLVIGGDADKAVKALAFPEIVEQFTGTEARIDNQPVDEPRTPTTRLGSFSFTELGFPSISLAGAFHQKATLTIQRPIRVDLGRESFIRIHFRHSAVLNPLRSILTVLVNGLQVGSAKLDPDNANGGVIPVRIPVTELSKNLWQIELQVYHDLATVDCSKSYMESAWTVIEGDSSLELNTGQLGGRPYLDAFPYLVGRDGIAPATCALSLSQTASDAELSLAATVAARAAQMNRHSFNWDVSYGNLPESKNSSIAIGYYDEASRFGSLADRLLVAPQGNGRFKIDPRLRLLDTALAGGAVLQAVRSPWNDGTVLYVLLGADDAALNRMAKFLADPKKVVDLTAEVALLKRDGTLVTLSTIGPNARHDEEQKEKESYSTYMKIFAGVLLLGFFVVVWLVAKQFVKRPVKPATKKPV